ncbi:MAG: 16S rRNA (guanine(527)-N(7))-methyltransferase RsmG [Bdellovibrionota bacterium]|nr:16S rRNA (guanine(527)-N(7))-methyltransferase RsmG [Bdellovibrionota bacterium]
MQELLEKKQYFLDLGMDEEAFAKLESYTELLWAANQELNLFSRKMPLRDLIENHLLDCALAFPEFLNQDFSVLADFGSGGGMPSVLLAILFSDREVRIFEKSPKKRQFLKRIQESLCPNIKIFEEVKESELEGVDLITARAFKPIDIILKLSRSYFQSSGKYLLYKAKSETIKKELSDAKLKDSFFKIISLDNPLLDVERNLVFISKI